MAAGFAHSYDPLSSHFSVLSLFTPLGKRSGGPTEDDEEDGDEDDDDRSGCWMAEALALLEGPPAVAEVPCWQPGRGPAGGEGDVFHNSGE